MVTFDWMKKSERSPARKGKRRKYRKPAFRSARFAEKYALACMKVEGLGQEGCQAGYNS